MVDEPQQHPHRHNHPLVRDAVGIQAQVIAAGYWGNAVVPFQVVEDPLRRGGRLVPQQAHHLGPGQRPVLGQPLDYVLFVC